MSGLAAGLRVGSWGGGRPASCIKGGMGVDENGTCSGLLRCPFCNSRMVTTKGVLVAQDALLHIPRPVGEDDGTPAAFTWESSSHTHWWKVADVDDFDSIGLSRAITSPGGDIKVVLCSECQGGPLGYKKEAENEVWLAADLMVQQDPAAASTTEDFEPPEGTDLEQLRAMMARGGLTTQIKVTFATARLGMCLADARDGVGVEVVAFTDSGDGQPGAAEATGEIHHGDKVVRVGGTSTKGLDYAAALDLILATPARPLTITFERGPPGGAGAAVAESTARVPHVDWRADDSPGAGTANS